MKKIRTLSCGCCTNGCTCWNHQDRRIGRSPYICEYHREHKHPMVTSEPEPNPHGPVEDWDLDVFTHAHHFTISMPHWTGRRATIEYEDFAKACLDAWNEPTWLVYAVSERGRSACLVRERWSEYLELWKQK